MSSDALFHFRWIYFASSSFFSSVASPSVVVPSPDSERRLLNRAFAQRLADFHDGFLQVSDFLFQSVRSPPSMAVLNAI